MHIKIVVSSSDGEYTFEAIVHQFNYPDDFHLDPETFYEKWGKAIPKIPHHEIEIKAPGAEFFEELLLKEVVLHVHKSRKNSDMLFVCYPRRISTQTAATRIFRSWCLGSVLTLVEEVDLNTILEECNNDHVAMERTIKDRYGIEIKE